MRGGHVGLGRVWLVGGKEGGEIGLHYRGCSIEKFSWPD